MPGSGELHSRLGRFELLEVLGVDGFGTVYQARDPELDRVVALKVPRSAHPLEGEARERFLREARSVAKLRHPGIVAVHEVGEIDGVPFIVSDFVPGVTLDHLIRDRRPTPRETAQWMAQVADALQYAHEHGVLHRDIKASNILLDAAGHPHLMDFGLAQRTTGEATLTGAGTVLGTPASMIPEQTRGEIQHLDGRTDVYSLGVVLYQLLTGALPFRGSELRGLCRIVCDDPAPPRSLNDQAPHDLEAICLKAMAREPSRRYAHASEFADDLSRFLVGAPIQARGLSLGRRARRWLRRRRAIAAGLRLLTLLGVLAALALAYGYQGYQEAVGARTAAQEHLDRHEYAAAARSAAQGLHRVRHVPLSRGVTEPLADLLCRARHAQAACDLHELVERLRMYVNVDTSPSRDLPALEACCERVWAARGTLLAPSGALLGSALQEQVRVDLLDVAIIWVQLRIQRAGTDSSARHREALEVLREAEESFGPSVALYRERQAHALALGLSDVAATAGRLAQERPPRSAWEHCVLGRGLLRSGQAAQAEVEFRRAIDLQAQSFWPHFYLGICACKLRRHEDAVQAFCVCIALRPQSAPCYTNRAVAHAALGHAEQALADCNRALQLDPSLAAASFERGILHAHAHRSSEAVVDLQQALHHGADPAAVHYHLAAIYLADNDRATALAHVQQALHHCPQHSEARRLYAELRPRYR